MQGAPLLVTGASGFLGRHLLQALQAGAAPRPALALVRDEAAWRGFDWTGKLDAVETVVGSVLEPEGWSADPRLARLGGIVHPPALVQHRRRRAAGAGEAWRTTAR